VMAATQEVLRILVPPQTGQDEWIKSLRITDRSARSLAPQRRLLSIATNSICPFAGSCLGYRAKLRYSTFAGRAKPSL
jgi:hypothetical protein